ncbi:hypothetical protein IFM89_020223 [Coptis chinensis]|uniref:Uncharacterized protein n=1 Tax=Coptis chinensis TaxID=261450 RepID=A0A835HKS9_9MAGN|nr:hypothetical protein IFM89_020223 [Coptis chinensis]
MKRKWEINIKDGNSEEIPSEEGIFLDGWLLSILESIPNPFGYTINLVPDPLFLRNGVRILVENDSDCLMMMGEEEELDPIPPMVEDKDALIEEEYDVLNPNNINIDEITPEEGYQSDELESEGSKGYEPYHEEFEKLTHEIIDEADEHITNNLSESFNQWIMDLRDKPVFTFVEELNLMLMTLMRKRRIKAMEMDINDVLPR